MKLRISGKMLIKLCCYVSLAISFLPVVGYYSPWYITLLPVLIALLLTLRMNSNVYPLLVSVSCVLGLGCMTFWIVQRTNPFVWFFINFVITFIPAILAVQIGEVVEEEQFYRDYLRVLAIFVGVTCITTIIGLNIYPMASRELATGSELFDTERYLKINIGGYDFIYALVLLIPFFFWTINSTKGFWKFVYTLILILSFLCIYASQYTLALICSVIALLLIWMFKNKKIGGMAFVLLLAFVIFNGLPLISRLFFWASDVVGHEYVSDRLLQVAQLFAGQNVDTNTTDARIEHYANQLRSFLESPFWGHNLFRYHDERVSGHSQVLDILGGSGIIGFGAMACLVHQLYSRVINPQRRKLSPCVAQIWLLVCVVAMLNPVFCSTVVTVAFMCCMCIEKIENGRSETLLEGQNEQ